jgi:hypothetical protein
MTFDRMYSYLIDLAWFFLGSWVALLGTMYVAVFNPGWMRRAKQARG